MSAKIMKGVLIIVITSGLFLSSMAFGHAVKAAQSVNYAWGEEPQNQDPVKLIDLNATSSIEINAQTVNKKLLMNDILAAQHNLIKQESEADDINLIAKHNSDEITQEALNTRKEIIKYKVTQLADKIKSYQIQANTLSKYRLNTQGLKLQIIECKKSLDVVKHKLTNDFLIDNYQTRPLAREEFLK